MERIRYNIFKPQQNGGGAAAFFSYDPSRWAGFIELRSQDGTNRTFDRDNRLIFKLSNSDIGAMLRVLEGQVDGINPDGDNYKGLFHSRDNGFSILHLERKENRGYSLRLVVKENDQSKNIGIGVSWDEARILREYLLLMLHDMFNYQYQNDNTNGNGNETRETQEQTEPAEEGVPF